MAMCWGSCRWVFWTLFLIVGIKYLTFVLRADNHGDGGVIALTALLKSSRPGVGRTRWILISMGLFAACLLYGDGMITPAISVLSAVEGIRFITPVLNPYVVPLTITILAGLFLIQRRGTASVGGLFGPVILVWFCVLAVLGIAQIIRTPQVLSALFPWHAFGFLATNGIHGFVVLGAVFLVVTVGRGHLRRYGPFRQASDSPGMDGSGIPVPGVELPRSGGTAA